MVKQKTTSSPTSSTASATSTSADPAASAASDTPNISPASDASNTPSTESTPTPSSTAISWEAEEYIVRDKTTWWYVGLAVISLLLIALSIWLQSWFFIAVIVLSVVALLLYVRRPPRILHYSLTNKGLTEGDQLHAYSEFKSFGILQENHHFAIILTPRKRFLPRMTVYFPEAEGEEIVDAFGSRLPMEDVQLDLLDRLIRFLRI